MSAPIPIFGEANAKKHDPCQTITLSSRPNRRGLLRIGTVGLIQRKLASANGEHVIITDTNGNSGPKKKSLVLVIEDDVAIRGFVVAALMDEGYQVHEAGDGRAGLRLAQELDPTVILVDLVMPEMDGREFISLYRSDTAAPCRIILMSAASASEHAELETTVDHILSKPFEIDDLFDVVGRFCIES